MNNLVNISEGTSLAIHGLALIAESMPELVNVREAALRLNASEAHLAKVFAKLNKSGVIAATRGPLGGYSLERDPADISFLDVYQLFEAPIDLEGCPLGKKHCSFGSCIFEGRIHKVSQEIYAILKDTKISQLASTSRKNAAKKPPSPSNRQRQGVRK